MEANVPRKFRLAADGRLAYRLDHQRQAKTSSAAGRRLVHLPFGGSGRWPPRPSSQIIDIGIPLFFIARNRDGFWIAREAEGRIGGIFLLRGSAHRFARGNCGGRKCGFMLLYESLELDIPNGGNRFALQLAAAKSLMSRMFRSLLTVISGYDRISG